MTATGNSSHNTTVDETEVRKFAALAERWWDFEGPFQPLHRLNPVRLRFIQIRRFPHFFRVLFHSFKPENTGGISPFEAFATSLAARVGAGNIGGVAIAITLGGPGAVFWMWVIALGYWCGISPNRLKRLYPDIR